MPPLAHSARKKRDIPAQEYADHIRAVCQLSAAKAANVARYSGKFGGALRSAVGHAAMWHDLGKLELANQAVLASSSRNPLPVNHCDAGVAQLVRETTATGNPARLLAAFLVYAHHIGLPNFQEQSAR